MTFRDGRQLGAATRCRMLGAKRLICGGSRDALGRRRRRTAGGDFMHLSQAGGGRNDHAPPTHQRCTGDASTVQLGA